jgi:hypothetical protein
MVGMCVAGWERGLAMLFFGLNLAWRALFFAAFQKVRGVIQTNGMHRFAACRSARR